MALHLCLWRQKVQYPVWQECTEMIPLPSAGWLISREMFQACKEELSLIDSSVGKESTCNVGDPSLIPGLGRSCWRRDRLPTPVFLGFPAGSAGKESACNVGDVGLISELGRSPGEGKGYPLQHSDLENSMDYSHGIAKSRTRLSDFHFHFSPHLLLH